MAGDVPPDPPITDAIVARTLPAEAIGGRTRLPKQIEQHCMVLTVNAGSGPWTVWMDDDDAIDDFGGAGVNAIPGTEPGEAGFWVDTAHGQVGARDHGGPCADPWYGGCDCGAEVSLSGEVRSLLLDAGHRLVREHHRRRDRRAEERRQRASEEFWRRAVDWDSRILVGGSDAGWRVWAGDPPRNTGTVVLPDGPIPGELDPQFCGVAGDTVGLYAIRDPRQPQTDDAEG